MIHSGDLLQRAHPKPPKLRLPLRLTLLVVSLYFVFNNAFMQFMLPPGIPIAELLLLSALLWINPAKTLGRMGTVTPILPFIYWWVFSIALVLLGFLSHGRWALRDGTHQIESLFLVMGFRVAIAYGGLANAQRHLFLCLGTGLLLSLLFPWSKKFSEMLPTITTANGQIIPILTFTSTALLTAAAASLLMKTKTHGSTGLTNFVGFLFLLYSVVAFQARTVYLYVLALLALGFLFKRLSIRQMLPATVALVTITSFLYISDIEIQGRLGQPVSINTIIQHISTTWGKTPENFQGSAAGVGQRLSWWRGIFEDLGSHPLKLFTGLGFGHPLTDFMKGVEFPVREPHNSIMSVLGRLGIVGLLLFILIQILIFSSLRRAWKLATSDSEKNYIFSVITVMLLVWVTSIGEDAFEKPFFAIPYYFYAGTVIGFIYKKQHQGIGSHRLENQPSIPLQ